MPALRRALVVALLGITLAPVAARAVRPGLNRGLRAYPAAVMIGGRPYGWPPRAPWALRVYDLRGLDPLSLGTSAYRPSYPPSLTGSSAETDRAPLESLPPPPMPPAANSTSSTTPEILEVVPAPPPEFSAPRSGAREF